MSQYVTHIVFVAVCLLVTGACFAEDKTSLALIGGRLIDGTDSPALIDSVVLITGNKISAIGKEGAVDIPMDARIIDTDGLTVMPGLIDIHMHHDIVGHIDIADWLPAHMHEMRERVMPVAARAKLHSGVATVRDIGGNPENVLWLREQLRSGTLAGPRT